MSNNSPTQTPEWSALCDHQKTLKDVSIRTLFENDSNRFERFSVSLDGFLFDFSKHHCTSETLEHLCAFARTQDLEGKRDQMFSGGILNVSERRAVLHPALRGSIEDDVEVGGENVSAFVEDTLLKIKSLSDKIRGDKSITDVINIGIGGSDLGPRMVYKALAALNDGPKVHFVSNIDARALLHRLRGLKPENTAIIITSKTFTTLETLTNANSLKDWMLKELDETAFSERLYAISSNIEAANDFGVKSEHILPMRDWIGGRFSLWSAVGLSLAVAFGFSNFQKLLEGARDMDTHFKDEPLERNAPVISALLGVWYRNFYGYAAKAILPYAHDLRDLPKYLQQLDMESNGKGVSRDDEVLDYATGSVIFGEAGTNAQHAFMQLLHQSAEVVPADFIVIAEPSHEHHDHHRKLVANAFAQSKALMEGKACPEEPHKHFEGNRPSSTLLLKKLDAYHVGMLISFYEHVVFTQGILWNINSFDQWGVELGKVLAEEIATGFDGQNSENNQDSSTQGLIKALESL